MRFWVSHDRLMVGFELDREEIDLTQGIGDAIFDYLESELISGALAETAPDGSAWAPLRPSTVKRKGNDHCGIDSGSMVNQLGRGIRDIQPQGMTWRHPDAASGKLQGFHNGNPRTGQPPRRIVGWTEAAKRRANELVRKR
jgi:hypothetical protein